MTEERVATINDLMGLKLIGMAEHSGKVAHATKIGVEVSSGQKKGQHPVYITRWAWLMGALQFMLPPP